MKKNFKNTVLTFLLLIIAAALCMTVVNFATVAHAEDVVCTGGHTAHDGWTEFTPTTTIASGGKYYLNADIEVADTIVVGASSATTATLCLNGHKLTYTGETSVIHVANNGNFTLCDCGTGTKTLGFGTATGSGVTVEGGVICGGKGTGKGDVQVGGGVYVEGGTFNMYGGNIAGNTAGEGGGVYVGALNANKGTFNMHGGTITGNLSTRRGAVYVSNVVTGSSVEYTTFNLCGGGVVKGNRITASNTAESNVFLRTGNKIHITDNITGADLGVSFAEKYKGAFTTDYSAHALAAVPFTDDSGTGAIKYISGECALTFTVNLKKDSVGTGGGTIAGTTWVDCTPASIEVVKGEKFERPASPYAASGSGACGVTKWFSDNSGGKLVMEFTLNSDDSKYYSPEIHKGYTLMSEYTASHFGRHVEEKEASCTEDGVYECCKCENCGKYFNELGCTTEYTDHGGNPVISALGHDASDVWVSPATCSKVGIKIDAAYCRTCDKYFQDRSCEDEIARSSVEIPRLEHSYVYHAATTNCEADGNYAYIICETGYSNEYDSDAGANVDKYELYRVVTAADTSLTVATTITISGTEYNCTAMRLVTGTETDGGKVYDIPSDIIIPKNSQGHTLEVHERKEPTCTQDGYEAYSYCTVCHKYFDGENNELTGVTPGSVPNDVKIPASHKLEKVEGSAPTCDTEGSLEHYKCSVCNKLFKEETAETEYSQDDIVVAATGVHTIEKNDAVEPTCSSTGSKEYFYCVHCDKMFADEAGTTELSEDDYDSEYVIAAIGHAFDGIKLVAEDIIALGTIDLNNAYAYLLCTNEDCNAGGEYSGGEIVSITYISDECLHGSDTYVTVKVKVNNDDEDNGGGAGEEYEFRAEVSVKKLKYNMSEISFANGEATADRKPHSIEISGTLPEGVTVTYEGNNQKEEGEYTVTAKFSGDYENYEEIPNMTATLHIKPSDGLGSALNSSSPLFYILVTAAVTIVIMLILFILFSLIMSKKRKKKAQKLQDSLKERANQKGGRDGGKRDGSRDGGKRDGSRDGGRGGRGRDRGGYDDYGGNGGAGGYDDYGGNGGAGDYDDYGGNGGAGGYDDYGGNGGAGGYDDYGGNGGGNY